jgi:hypothetical protein
MTVPPPSSPVPPPRRARASLAAAILAGAVALAPLPGAATMYKWVDDKGVVHYSDKMPPEAVNKGSTQLSPQGIPVRKVDPAATPEAAKAREAEQERQKEAARQQGEQARRDRALLDSYTTEADIDLARARAVRTVEDALQSAANYRTQLQKRKVALLERKASYGGKPVPPDIDRDLAAIDAELARDATLATQKTKQLEEIKARYDADKARWRQLTGGGAAAGAPAAAGKPAVAPAPSAPAPGAPAVPAAAAAGTAKPAAAAPPK